VEDGVITREALTECLEVAKETPAKKIGETLIAKGKATPKQVSQALRKQSNQASEAASIRVDTSKLDDLIDMVGELVITQTMIRQNPVIRVTADEKMLRDISQLGSIISELQRTSTSLRMIPIKQTFQKITRLVRDLSKANGQKGQRRDDWGRDGNRPEHGGRDIQSSCSHGAERRGSRH